MMQMSTVGVRCLLFGTMSIFASAVKLSAPADGELREYCQWDTFEAQCDADQVIVITDAIYGRMDYGRCIRPEYGYLGCSANVRLLADAQCSGRQRCQIAVPDKLFDGTTPCREDLKLYLLVGYRCITVTTPTNGLCRNGDVTQPSPVTSQAVVGGLLSSVVSTSGGCGSPTSPWLIQVRTGQRINLTLVDFALPGSLNKTGLAQAGSGHTHCQVYAVIKEQTGGGQGVTVCGRAGRTDSGVVLDRETNVYLSDTNKVEIRLLTSRLSKDFGQFLIRYQAVGCPDIESPKNGWWRREGFNATIGCTSDWSNVRYLVCVDGVWHGDTTSNCPDVTSLKGSMTSLISGSHSAMMILILCIAVAVGFTIFIGGLCIIQRRCRSTLSAARDKQPSQSRPVYIKNSYNKSLSRPVYTKEGTAAYMSVKCDNRSVYPNAIGTGTGAVLPYGLHYVARDDVYGGSGNSATDNEYAYVDEVMRSFPTNSYDSAHEYTTTGLQLLTPRNNNCASTHRPSDHVTDHLTSNRLVSYHQYELPYDEQVELDVPRDVISRDRVSSLPTDLNV